MFAEERRARLARLQRRWRSPNLRLRDAAFIFFVIALACVVGLVIGNL